MSATQILKQILTVLVAVVANGKMLVKLLDSSVRVEAALARLEANDKAQDAKLEEILVEVKIPPPPTAARFVITISNPDGGNQTTVEEGTTMDAKVGSVKLATIEKAVDKFGNDAAIDGAPSWGSAGDAVQSVVPSADGMSALITLGTVAKVSGQVTVTGDGDPGPDQALFHSTLDFSTIPDNAVEFKLSVSDAPPA